MSATQEAGQMNIEDVRSVGYVYRELLPISRKLHRIAEANCNYGNTTRRDNQETKLLAQAEALAQRIGLHAYHQGDPRGCALYLIDDTMIDSTYSNGLAVY